MALNPRISFTPTHIDPAKVRSLLAMVAVHVLIGFLLITGLRGQTAAGHADALKLFDIVSPEPPPPPPPTPARAERAPEQGAAAPPALRAEAAPIVAPPPAIVLPVPPPVVAAPITGIGAAPSQGAAPVPGPGTGSGGDGAGTGSGAAGTGGGNGSGAAIRTRRIQGNITSNDYPRDAERAGAQGMVVARLTIGTNGRVAECRLRASSGNASLDAATCGLLVKRFRFLPARDASGRPVPDTIEWEQEWTLRQENSGPEADERRCRAAADANPDRNARRATFMTCMAAAGWVR